MSTRANPKKRKWFKWYHLYCLLAAFDVLTISVSLYLNHTVLGIYSASVEVNSVWSDRVGNYSKLSELAAAVNAPGNDAFDSGDIVGERRRLAEAHAAIQKATTTARQDLEQNTRSERSHELLRLLSKIDAQVALIHKEATAVFVELENNRQDFAGSRMAAMDRCFSQSLVLIGALCEKVRDIQSARFEAETTRAQRLSNFEFALASVVCLILCIATWYGHKMANFMRRSELVSLDYEGQIAAICKSQMVIEFDLDGTITKVNDKFLQSMGYSQEEVIGKHHSMFVEPAHRESDEYREFWEKLNRGEYVSAELKRVAKDGKEVWLQASYTPILDLNDKPYKVVKLSVDVTDQKILETKYENQIADAKARLERATNGTSDGLWDYTPATAEVWYADQFKELVGFEPHEYDQFEPTLEPFVDLLHPDDKDRTFAAINAHLEDDVPYDVEYRLRMRKGGYRWFRARGRAIRDEHGVATSMSGSICDVQATRDAFDLVEQANKAKSEFLANMSHEIRTPMTAILGYAELLDGDLANDPDQAADAVRTIQSNANHLLMIINDILDVSKIEAGQMVVEAIETRPTQIISEVLSLVRPRATGKGIRVGVSYDTPIPAHIESDPTRLRQILLNLIGNAIKFTEVGSVTIHASCDPKSQQMKLSVVDTGIGMSPEQCEVISKFEAFSQADASTTRKFGGTGLGLRISNALAEMLGGGIAVSSVLGEGSTFTATIATGDLDRVTMLKPEEAIYDKSQDCTNDQEQAASKPAAGKPLNGLRILLAEDGPDNQRLIRFILKKAGADVTVCENGLIAAQTLENADDQELPNVVLMDMEMPVLDGYDATRQLRKNGYTLPIIALTAHAMPSHRKKCLDAGCDDYAAKPVDREKLIELVASYAKRVECGRGATPRNDSKPSTSQPAGAQRAETSVLLSGLADEKDIAELVDTFLADLGPKAALVAELYAEHRLGELTRLAHQLKGASGGYGFPAISEAAEKVELQATADPDLRQLKFAVDELTRVCAQAIAGRPAAGASEPAGAPAMEYTATESCSAAWQCIR